MMNRILYLFYYLKVTEKNKFIRFFEFVKHQQGVSSLVLVWDILKSCVTYNISFLDYFYFRFYKQDKNERKFWAGTGFMYEFQRKHNPKWSRSILEDKVKFLNTYCEYVHHSFATIDEIKRKSDNARKVFANSSRRVVLKDSHGQCGFEVEVISVEDKTLDDIIKLMEQKGFDIMEEYILQHEDLMKLSSSGLNTIRIFTQLTNSGEVDILGCRLRITVNSKVDNLASGNIAAPVDEKSGIIIGPAVYSDITKDVCYNHPISMVKIEGFQIPFWQETISMIKEAAKLRPENRSIGWDIAITQIGPDLIEGNHNWCKLLWQLPVQKGLKPLLLKYL